MLILIKNNALITGLSDQAIKDIKKHLSIVNPMFNKKMDLGLSIWGVPTQLQYFEEETVDNGISLRVPIGSLTWIIPYLQQEWGLQATDIVDSRLSLSPHQYFSNLKFKGKLRAYQQEMVDSCLDKTVGVVQAKTGSGKTVTFVGLTLAREEPTLILVHTLELAMQTVKSFLNFTDIRKEDIGFIGDGRFELKPVTVGLHQTMAKLSPERLEAVNATFGQIIADEAHIVAASTWYNTMCNLDAKYKYGFTATPSRDDGLTEVIHFATGPIIHIVPDEALADVLIIPTYRVINTNYSYDLFSTQEYTEMIADLSVDQDRNQLILDTWKNEYKDKMTCFLCLRQSQVDILQEELGDIAVSITSKTPKKKRLAYMEALTTGEKRVVISTYGLFSTGIDLPSLEVAFLCGPIRSPIKLKQTGGRLMRIAEGKVSAEIVDFADKNIDILKYQYYARSRVLKNL